jgi:methyl-accepting chemotaxis protein
MAEQALALPVQARRLTLFAKIALLLGGALVVFALAVSTAMTRYFSGVLRNEALERGRAVSSTLAATVASLPELPPEALTRILAAAKSEANLAYVEIVAPSGAVIAHTFAGRLPRHEPDHRSERQLPREGVVDGVSVIDVPTAAANGAIVHVGLELAAIDVRLRGARLWLFVISAAGLLLAFAGAALAGGRIVRPLRALTSAAQRVLDGDLSQPVDTSSSDEIGDLADAFRQMVRKLVEVLGALQESARLLTEAGDKLSSSTQEQSQTITRQATALQETQVTAQEIKQTSLLAAQKAEAVLRLTEKADEVSTSGEEAIERSLGGLTDIRAQVEDISQRIAQLSERTQQIGSITATVKDLADQSNMLALNAAIEAVRSGEHGKGFAVVAREIRSLADQSIQATNRVREILEDIGGAIRGAVAITERGSQKIEGGLLQVKASGDNLRELSNIVKDNSSAVRQIAAAVSQQNAGITQIFSAVTDQTRMMDETMRRLETTTQAASVLKDLSQRVSDVVRRFRV